MDYMFCRGTFFTGAVKCEARTHLTDGAPLRRSAVLISALTRETSREYRVKPLDPAGAN